jgi:hypothetical protein
MKRPLDLMDAYMWYTSLRRQIAFVLVGRLRGALPVDRLGDAIARLEVRYPLLRARVSQEGGAAHYITDDVPPLPVRVVERLADDQWLAEAAADMSRPFPLATGPLTRLTVVRADGGADLLLNCHHAIGDGLSALYALRDLMRLLGAPETVLEPLPELPRILEMAPPQVMARLAQLTPAEWQALLGVGEGGGSQSPILVAPAPDITTESPLRLLAWALTAEQTVALVARSHEEGASVHSALGAAFMRASGEVEGQGRWERTVLNPVDIRSRLVVPVGEAFQNFFAGEFAGANCAPDRDLWEVARDLRAALAHVARDERLFGEGLAFQQVLDHLPEGANMDHSALEQRQYDLSLSNLGRVDIPTQYGALQLDALYGPVVNGFERERGLGVITYDGVMRLVYAFREAALLPEEAARICDRAMYWLGQAVGW